MLSPVRRVRWRLQFLGQQIVPDHVEEETAPAVAVAPQLPGPDPIQSQPARVEPASPRPDGAGEAVALEQRVLRPCRPTTYRDNRAWTRRKMLAGFLGVMTAPAIALAKGVDIELASGELSERQRQEISVEADLDTKAPVF